MKFSIKDIFSKCDQIPSFLRIWSHLLKKSLMGNFIFCAVYTFLWNFLLIYHISLDFHGKFFLRRNCAKYDISHLYSHLHIYKIKFLQKYLTAFNYFRIEIHRACLAWLWCIIRFFIIITWYSRINYCIQRGINR